MQRSSSFACWAWLAGFVLASTAMAEERATARFDWVRLPGAESCPSAESMQADVRQRLGYDPFQPGSRREISGVVARRNNRWEAQLLVRDGTNAQGSREIASEAPDCASLGAAVALAVTVAIDPDAMFRKPAETPPKVETPPAPVERPWNQRPRTGIGALVSTSLPAPAVGLSLSVTGPAWKRLSWGAGAFGLPMRKLGNAGFALMGGWGEVCVGPELHSNVSVRGCGRFLGGVLEAYVFPTSAFRSVAPGHYRWLAGEGVAKAAVHVWGPLFVEGEAGALLSITRQPFLADGQTKDVFREPVVAFLGGLSAGLTF